MARKDRHYWAGRLIIGQAAIVGQSPPHKCGGFDQEVHSTGLWRSSLSAIGTSRSFERDELQQDLLTNSISACFLYPQSEYDSNTHLAHPCTSRGEGIMVNKILAVLIVLTTAASLPSAAKMRGPSTPEERARAVEYVRSLDENPLAKDGLAIRMWLTEWIVEVPDLTVNACCKELESLDKVNNTYSNQLRMQMVYSQAAFLLQHPEEKNTATIQAAGLAGTLRAYRAIQRFDPTAKYPLLDNLISLEKQGKLQQYVQKKKCKDN